ncbi:MAG TPA: hypothetical protein PLN45_06320 [Exilispira sp.]|nr:hypothetical protein [Spirochaetota bacterium]NLJ04289.1 hypothetical protein [Exilispira sp.]HNV43938.1 hypothetical protein [Exilispira sp.]HPO61147.1 hypothetical protein [Exilispira sp.]
MVIIILPIMLAIKNIYYEKINWNIKCKLSAFSQPYSSIIIYDGIIYVSSID